MLRLPQFYALQPSHPHPPGTGDNSFSRSGGLTQQSYLPSALFQRVAFGLSTPVTNTTIARTTQTSQAGTREGTLCVYSYFPESPAAGNWHVLKLPERLPQQRPSLLHRNSAVTSVSDTRTHSSVSWSIEEPLMNYRTRGGDCTH